MTKVSNKQDSNKQVSNKNKCILWAKSAGRCQYSNCNELLWKDPSAKTYLNKGYVAHIIANSSRGSRGDDKLSEERADEISNLMLLCDKHHRLIDRDDIKGHPIEKLKEIKKLHEEQIEDLTSLVHKQKTKIIIYSANIGPHNSSVDCYTARRAVLPERVPYDKCVKLALKHFAMEDNEEEYWDTQVGNLKRLYNRDIKQYLEDNEYKHLTFFGIAPIPLLIKFGTLLPDLYDVEVRQLMKESEKDSETWNWDSTPNSLRFDLNGPPVKNPENDIALVISTSAKINDNRVTSVLSNVNIWEIEASNIGSDNIRTKKCLEKFRKIFRRALSEIERAYPKRKCIHVFPAVSVAVATEMGRVWNGKSNFPMKIYDNNNNNNNKNNDNQNQNGFCYTLTIGENQ